MRQSCHGRPLLAVRPSPPCRPAMSSIRLGFPSSSPRWRPSVGQHHSLGPPIRAPTIETSAENSIASRRTHAPTAFSPTEFLHRLRDAETLNSFTCVRLSQSCLPESCSGFSATFTTHHRLTTAACGGFRSTPDCRPRRTYLHLPYSCASPCGPALLVTQDP